MKIARAVAACLALLLLSGVDPAPLQAAVTTAHRHGAAVRAPDFPYTRVEVHRWYNAGRPRAQRIDAPTARKLTRFLNAVVYARIAAYLRAIGYGCAPGNPAACEALIRATAPRYGVSPSAAVKVGRCESGLNPAAYNPASGASGMFQQLARYWPGRAAAYGYAGRSPFDPIANVNVSLAMVRDTGGWSHWVCRP